MPAVIRRTYPETLTSGQRDTVSFNMWHKIKIRTSSIANLFGLCCYFSLIMPNECLYIGCIILPNTSFVTYSVSSCFQALCLCVQVRSVVWLHSWREGVGGLLREGRRVQRSGASFRFEGPLRRSSRVRVFQRLSQVMKAFLITALGFEETLWHVKFAHSCWVLDERIDATRVCTRNMMQEPAAY